MQKHLGLAPSPHLSKSDENLLLAEVEAVVRGPSGPSRERDGLASGGTRRARRRYVVLMSVVALAAVLVPAGFKTSDLLARAAHFAANN